MPQRETIIARIPRDGLISNVELRVSHRARGRHAVRGVHIGEWWLPPLEENSAPNETGVVIHPSELDAVILALTEAKGMLASVPWRTSVSCTRCESLEARLARRVATDGGSLPPDYYCDLCGAVDGPLRKEPPVIDLTGDENHNWLHDPERCVDALKNITGGQHEDLHQERIHIPALLVRTVHAHGPGYSGGDILALLVLCHSLSYLGGNWNR